MTGRVTVGSVWSTLQWILSFTYLLILSLLLISSPPSLSLIHPTEALDDPSRPLPIPAHHHQHPPMSMTSVQPSSSSHAIKMKHQPSSSSSRHESSSASSSSTFSSSSTTSSSSTMTLVEHESQDSLSLEQTDLDSEGFDYPLVIPPQMHELDHRISTHPPLLNRRVASFISSLSLATRVSLRVSSLLVDYVFDGLKFSTSTTLGLGRRALVAAVSSARNIHCIASPLSLSGSPTLAHDHPSSHLSDPHASLPPSASLSTSLTSANIASSAMVSIINTSAKTPPSAFVPGIQEMTSFLPILDRYTLTSIYAIQNAFSLAEMLTLSTFHLTSSTIKLTLTTAEDCVQMFDGLFGETETSKALAAFIAFASEELKGRDGDLQTLTRRFGRVTTIGHIAKALTAFCCLQYVNRKRSRSHFRLKLLFEGSLEKQEAAVIESDGVKGSVTAAASATTMESVTDIVLPDCKSFHAGPSFGVESVSFGNGDEQSKDVDFSLDERRSPSISSPRLNAPSYFALPPAGVSPPKAMTAAILQQGSRLSVSDYRQISAEFQHLPQMAVTSSTSSVSSPLSPSMAGIPAPVGHSANPHYAEPRIGDIPVTAHAYSLTDPSITELIRAAHHYVAFSSGSYGTAFLKILGLGKSREPTFSDHVPDTHHNHKTFAEYTSIQIKDILSSSYQDPASFRPPCMEAPVHYIVLDHATRAVVLSLRGTLGLSDLITDLTAHYSDYMTPDGQQGHVHAGMLRSAEKISAAKLGLVRDALLANPGYSLVLTGHSLGGGVATCLTVLWSHREPGFEDEYGQRGPDTFHTSVALGFPMRPIHCYVFGCPAVFDAALGRTFKGLISGFIYRNDFIPSLSVGLIRDFRNVATNLIQEQGLAERIIGHVLGLSSFKDPQPEPDDLWYWAVLKTLRADMRSDKLYPPGNMYWINASNPIHPPDLKHIPLTLHLVEDVELAFSESIFSKTMFFDHITHNYENAMDSLVAALSSEAGQPTTPS